MILNSGGNILQTLCKCTKQWGMYIATVTGEEHGLPPLDYFAEQTKAAPYLEYDPDNPKSIKNTKTLQIMIDGEGYLLFDSEEILDQHFYVTIGDDGPTKLNTYDGPGRWYALTCNPDGQLLNENT